MDGYSQILALDRNFNLKWAKKIVTYKKYPTDYGDTWIAPLMIKSDGTIVAGVRYAGYYTPQTDIWHQGEGYFEFSNSGIPNSIGRVFHLPTNYESKASPFSFVLSKEDNIVYITAFNGPENICRNCVRRKFGLVKTDINNSIDGSCVGSYETPLVWEDLQDISFNEVEYSFTDLDITCSDTTPLNLIENGNVRWINTFCPVINQVNKLQNPFRLEIIGENYIDLLGHLTVYINDVPVPKTTWKSTQRIIAKKDDALKNMLPKGVPVCIQVKVLDYSGNLYLNYQSDCFYFTR